MPASKISMRGQITSDKANILPRHPLAVVVGNSRYSVWSLLIIAGYGVAGTGIHDEDDPSLG